MEKASLLPNFPNELVLGLIDAFIITEDIQE